MLTHKQKFEIQHNHKNVIELDDLPTVEVLRHKSNLNIDGGQYAQAVRLFDLEADQPKSDFDKGGFEMEKDVKNIKIRNQFEKEVVKLQLQNDPVKQNQRVDKSNNKNIYEQEKTEDLSKW